MGKIKRRKLRTARYTPLTSSQSENAVVKSDENILNDDQVIEIKSKVDLKSMNHKGGIKVVREKINSTSSDENLTGLNMLAAFALEGNGAETLVQNKIVLVVAPLLRSPNSQVRLAAAGALRNLCLGGSDEVVDMMVKQNILPPLCQLLKEYLTNTPPSSKTDNSLAFSKGIANSMEENDEGNLIFIHATNLLWNLCECNEECIRVCNQEELPQVLLKHIDPFIWSYAVSMAAADCLLCISENNQQATTVIVPQADTLVNLAFKSISNNNDPVGLRFAIILSGILVNLNYWTPGGASFRQVFEVLSRALEIDPENLTLQLTQKNVDSEIIEYQITAQLLALEILSNICCPDEEELWEECEEEMSDDEVHNEDDSMDVGQVASCSILPEVLEGIKYYNLVEKILKKMSFQIQDIPVNDKTKDNIEKLRLLEIRSLQCYQNLVCVLDLSDLGGVTSLISTWFQFGKFLFSKTESDSLLLESSSGVMRAILDKLTLEKCKTSIDISEQDLKQLFAAGSTCSLATVRANLSRMVGNLGCLSFHNLSDSDQNLHETPSSTLISITDYLLQVSAMDDELYVRAEALDTLIDMFSDDKTDHLASQIRLIPRLKEIQPEFKNKHNKNRKKLGDHRPLVVTVRDNLIAFIKYKGPRTINSPSSNSGQSSIVQ